MGDGTLMEFGSVVDAVSFAVDVQQAMAERNAKVPEDRRITYRMGINLGDIIVEGDDIYGDGVNVAARMEGLAEPGGICLSDMVYQNVKAKLDLTFEDLGKQQVKNIPDPLRVFKVLLNAPAAKHTATPAPAVNQSLRGPLTAVGLVALVIVAGLALWQRPWEPREEPASVERMAFPLPDKPSIAVLPFTNMSDDPAQEHFADGMTDDLITDLSKVSGLFVIARNSTFVYKNRPVEIRQVAEALGVRYVVEGSVRRAGDTVRVNAQLIDATTGGHVWADRYDGEIANIFAVQDDFVRKIVEALAINLAPQEAQQIGQGQTDQTAAREAFQKGWELYLRFNAEDNAKAIQHLETAVELDPEYGRAYAVLSLAYLRSYIFDWGTPLGMGIVAVRQAAGRSLEQAKEYPTALVHVYLSLEHLYYGRQEKAFDEAARAISLDPNEPEAHTVMGWVMINEGKPDQGLGFIEAAMRLNPHYPSHYVMARGVAYFAKGDFELAANEFRARLEQDPQAIELAPLLASAYGLLGRREEARAALQLWRPTASQLELSNIPYVYTFPFIWGYDHREVRERLFDGMHIAALPLEVTVPSLVESLQSDDPFARLIAIKALGRFGPMAEPAIPALIAALDDEQEDVRKGGVLALAKIGPAAKDAIPALEAMREESLIGKYAIEALEKIRDK
jgi:TolB-like protein/Flp pilus assembly protein TadD